MIKIKIFFATQPWWEELYRIFKKFFPWILQFSGGISVVFLKKKKKKRVEKLNISISTMIRYSQNLREKIGNCKKSNMRYKGVVKLNNSCKAIVNDALHFHRFWRIRSTCVTKVGCPFWTCRTLPLNSKIDPDTPWKHQKIRDFLIFSRVIKWEQWAVMSLITVKTNAKQRENAKC